MDPEKTKNPIILEKTVSAPQDSPKPELGHSIKLRTWIDSQPQQKSVTETYLLGKKQLNQQIQSIVLQMKVGDTWKVKLFNNSSQQQLIINIQLISSQKLQNDPNVIISLNARAEQQKKIGNQLLKQKKLDQAIKSYKKCYQLIQYNCDKQAVEIRLSVVSNLALATLNSNKFYECLEWCEKYLAQTMEINKKILYRQISAFKGLREWETAKEKVGKALSLCQQDKQAVADFSALRQTIENQQKLEIKKQKKLYTNMFG